MIRFKKDIFKELLRERDFSFMLLIFTVFLLPFSINFSTFTLILSLFFKGLQVLFLRFKIFETKALKTSSLIGFVFFMYMIVSSIVQTDVFYSLEVFPKQFQHWTLLFLMPLLIRSQKTNKLLLSAFFLGVCASIIYVFVVSFIEQMSINQDSFERIVETHHTYLSIFLLFIINYFLLKLIKNQDTHSLTQILVQILIISGCFWLIYLVDSKVSVILFVVLFIIHVFPELSKKNSVKYLSVFLTVLMASFLFNKKLKTSYEAALDFRLQIWEVSVQSISENPVFGNLKSSEKGLLNFKHYINGKYYYLDRDLNSHNQYLSILLKYGFIGALLLMGFAVLMFNKTNPNTGKLMMRETIGFISIILLVFYIENVLDRHQGIVFFTVFYNYYLVGIENAKT